MEKQVFIDQRNALLEKKEAHDKEINLEYTRISKEYFEANSPVELHKVYELKENGHKRRGFKRFVVYDWSVKFWEKGFPFIQIGGWWLDVDNVPTRWDNYTVDGIGNPAIFVLSKNQEHKPHPQAKEEDKKQ